jgi:adenylate kinase family enzyme
MQRISVVGTSGSGKTTLARQISQRLAIPHVELDMLSWEPNWKLVPNDVVQQRISQALACDSWVVDGNLNSSERDIIWTKADTVVFLDYPLLVVMRRILWRTVRRVVTQTEVCNGNRETWKTALSKDSVILWALQTYQKRRRDYLLLFAKPEYAHLNIVHLTSPASAKDWLFSL